MSSHTDDHHAGHGKGQGRVHGHAPPAAAALRVCRCGLTSWPLAMTCACMVPLAPAPDDHHDDHEPPKPKPPTFGKEVPVSVQEGLRAAWLGLEAGRPPVGIIADCERAVLLMLNELDGKCSPGRARPKRKPWVWWNPFSVLAGPPPPPPPLDMKSRILALIGKGVLLSSLKSLIDQVDLPSLKAIRGGAPLGSPAQAEAFVHLALMIADQGFAHPQWARSHQRPPQWP